MSISKKRLEEIKAIKDKDIDLSDIPELDKTFWENAVLIHPEKKAWGKLKSLLQFRIKSAESGAISKKTMRQIALDKLKKLGAI